MALKIVIILGNSVDPGEIKRHSIWVFTVWPSTCLPLSKMKRVSNYHDAETSLCTRTVSKKPSLLAHTCTVGTSIKAQAKKDISFPTRWLCIHV